MKIGMQYFVTRILTVSFFKTILKTFLLSLLFSAHFTFKSIASNCFYTIGGRGGRMEGRGA